LPFLVHRSEPAVGSSTFRTSSLCHIRISLARMRKS
jgi:hypothetical protein